MSGPNFNNSLGKGRLAVDRYDFENHVTGVNRLHSDTQITISTPISNITATNVHEALVELNTAILNANSLIVVGDGYDIYQTGVYDSGVGNFDPILIDLFTNTSGIHYPRLRDGAIVLIKSGTYKIGATVEIPAGVTVMGEGFGTKLINVTTTTAPALTSKVMFIAKGDLLRAEDSGITSSDTTYDPFLNSKTIKLLNLVIADNFIQPRYLGDTYYVQPQNTALPLIYIQHGTSLSCEGVTFMGRSVAGIPAQTSYEAIGMDPSFGSSAYSTNLSIRDCKIDGFNRLLEFTPGNGTLDSFIFSGNEVRIFGPPTFLTEGYSSIIFMNGCNASITDNYIWASVAITAFVFVDSVAAPSITYHGRSKIRITNNTLVEDKLSDLAGAITPIQFSTTAIAAADTNVHTVVYGNVFDEVSGFSVSLEADGTKVFHASETIAKLGKSSTTEMTLDSGSGYITMDAGTTGSFTFGTTLLVESGDDVTMNVGTAASGGRLFINCNDGAGAGSRGSVYIDCEDVFTVNADGYALIDAGSYIELSADTDVNLNAAVEIELATVMINMNGAQKVKNRLIQSSDSVNTTDYVVLVDTSLGGTNGAITVTLPVHNAGRVICIKDVGGMASIYNITIARNGGTGNIDDYAGDRTIATNWSSLTFLSDGSNWYII